MKKIFLIFMLIFMVVVGCCPGQRENKVLIRLTPIEGGVQVHFESDILVCTSISTVGGVVDVSLYAVEDDTLIYATIENSDHFDLIIRILHEGDKIPDGLIINPGEYFIKEYFVEDIRN